jgi:hypothetical protein
MLTSMKAIGIFNRRVAYSERAFAEMVLWRLAIPVPGSSHHFKYRLAYVVDGVCVLRYDNESGKGDHRHISGIDEAYSFSTPEILIGDFRNDIARWNDENSHA